MDEDDILLRRRLLKTLERTNAPLQLNDLAESEAGRTEADAVKEELINLEGWEYVENVYNPASPYYRITQRGRDMLNKRTKHLDENIWGRLAL